MEKTIFNKQPKSSIQAIQLPCEKNCAPFHEYIKTYSDYESRWYFDMMKKKAETMMPNRDFDARFKILCIIIQMNANPATSHKQKIAKFTVIHWLRRKKHIHKQQAFEFNNSSMFVCNSRVRVKWLFEYDHNVDVGTEKCVSKANKKFHLLALFQYNDGQKSVWSTFEQTFYVYLTGKNPQIFVYLSHVSQ